MESGVPAQPLQAAVSDALDTRIGQVAEPMRITLRDAHASARMVRGFDFSSPCDLSTAWHTVDGAYHSLQACGRSIEALAWAVRAFAEGRDADVARVAIDLVDAHAAAILRAALARHWQPAPSQSYGAGDTEQQSPTPRLQPGACT